MKLTESTLRRIIMEELAAVRESKRLTESRRPVLLTPEALNRIIREEYNRANKES